MKNIIRNILASLARKILKKYHPLIVGITGSMGKTSTKEAVFDVVSQKYRARKSEKNFNNEMGLPLTIIGSDAPGRNPAKWLAILLKSLWLIFKTQKYPAVLVLEMGIDRPGDMDHLLSIVHPNVAVITGISVTHLEFFKDVNAISEEKGKIAACLKPGDTLIVNADNSEALKHASRTKGKILTYGMKNSADVCLRNIEEKLDEPLGTSFTVKIGNSETRAKVRALGESHLSAIAAACAVAEALRIENDLLLKGLGEYKPVPGRLNIIDGIKRSVLIDDTYNSSPEPVKAALRLLHRIPAEYKIAVLGDMLELGSVSEAAHREIGAMVADIGVDKLITVGPAGKLIAEGAKVAGMEAERVLCFDVADEAKKQLQELMPPKSLVLIKGSQGMRMEKITKEVMAEPMRSSELLCRQYGKWLKT